MSSDRSVGATTQQCQSFRTEPGTEMDFMVFELLQFDRSGDVPIRFSASITKNVVVEIELTTIDLHQG